MTGGPTLAISASGPQLLCALRTTDGQIVTPRDADPQRGADLAAIVAELLATSGLTPDSLESLRIDVGPGSYTGLRVAVTFAKIAGGLRRLALAEFTSIELLACGAHADGIATGVVQVVLDARRDRAHLGTVRIRDARVELIDPPRAVRLAALPAALRDDATLLVADSLQEIVGRHRGHAMRGLPACRADTMFASMLRPRTVDARQIEPLYLMGSYVET